MIRFHGLINGRLERVPNDRAREIADVLWIDLCDPSREEEAIVETVLGFQIPTRQEMAEIEESARLYNEGGALVMTSVIIDGAGESRPVRTEVTFLLARDRLVTVRYANPMLFRAFEARIVRQLEQASTAPILFVSLLESFTERVADVLESASADLNQVSDTLFDDEDAAAPKARPDMQALIRILGRKHRALSIVRESLLSFDRLIPFLRQGGAEWIKNGPSTRLKTVARDVNSLAAYEAQLAQEIGFLHEAALGLINNEQNNIIKVFSIAAVLFLPPTLVGTVYGMNFDVMPELNWAFGYPFALGTMLFSAVVPYYWFKRRGWL